MKTLLDIMARKDTTARHCVADRPPEKCLKRPDSLENSRQTMVFTEENV
ncbi:hypothetical protein [Geoalkalibacter subterraneus]|nr:hypothetical protein [Geoalkalibacter subterraneus]